MKKIILTIFLTLILPIMGVNSDEAYGYFWSKKKHDPVTGKGYVPKAANAAVRELDRQLLMLGAARDELRIAFTVAANVDNLTKTNGLARQMSEEVARGLKQLGYRVIEIRKGSEVVMIPEVGELLLTRDRDKLTKKSVASELIMAGTYTISGKGIRFNIRLIHTNSTEVIAMATTTVPLYPEIKPLLIENEPYRPLGPTVGTRLSY